MSDDYDDDTDYSSSSQQPVTVDFSSQLGDTSIGGANGNATQNELGNEAEDLDQEEGDNIIVPKGSSSSSSSNNSSGSSAANTTAGALGSLLKSLGIGSSSSSNAGLLNALLGLTSAAGAYKTNKSAATLPSMPSLPGGANTTGLGAFAPTNLAAANAAGQTGIGTGNAPLTQTNYNRAPSYYTYGQGPEQQYFQQVNPSGGPIAPVTAMKTGGTVQMKRFDLGGAVNPLPGQQPVIPPSQAPGSFSQPGSAPDAVGGALSAMRPAQPAQGAPQGNPVARAVPAPTAAQMPGGGALTRPAPPQQPQSTMMQRMTAANPMATHAAPAGGLPMRPQVRMADGGPAPLPPGFGIPSNGYNAPQVNMAQSKLEQGAGNGLQRGPRKVGVNSSNPGMATGGALSGSLGTSQPMASRHVQGPGDGTSDSIPARLAAGEFVLSSDVVSSLGNGDNKAGARRLDEFMKSIRKHKATGMSKGVLPPDAKSPEQYLGKLK